MTPREAVQAYWTAAQARDWDAFTALLSDDIVYELPQSRERIRGKERYLTFNTEYPADWHATLRHVVAESGRAVSWTDFLTNGEPEIVVTFFTFGADGLIQTVTDFWPEPFEAAAYRAGLVERY